jgi:hypothetical protein
METLNTNDLNAHAANIANALSEVIDHMRAEMDRVQGSKAQALFDTGADVLTGLRTGTEKAR